MDNAEFMTAHSFMRKNPDPVFEQVLANGFELWYQEDEEGGLHIHVTMQEERVGHANFSKGDSTTDIQNIEVNSRVREIKLATAMCLLAFRIWTKPLKNMWNSRHLPKKGLTEDGKAFWNSFYRRYPELCDGC